MTAAERFARLPTAAKLLVILTAVLLPIGTTLVWLGESGIRQANEALKGRAEDQSRAAAESMEGLLARDALALRVAANGALAEGTGDACARALRSLTIAPGIAQSFELETSDAKPICAAGTVGDMGSLPLVAPGSIVLRIAPGLNGVAIRVGVIGGMATAFVPEEVNSNRGDRSPGRGRCDCSSRRRTRAEDLGFSNDKGPTPAFERMVDR